MDQVQPVLTQDSLQASTPPKHHTKLNINTSRSKPKIKYYCASICLPGPDTTYQMTYQHLSVLGSGYPDQPAYSWEWQVIPIT